MPSTDSINAAITSAMTTTRRRCAARTTAEITEVTRKSGKKKRGRLAASVGPAHYARFSQAAPFMKALLLPPIPGNERFGLGPFFRIEPLGMEYIAAALAARGHRVTLADLRFSSSVEQQMRRARPDLVGIAAMHALETDEVIALARRVRHSPPRCRSSSAVTPPLPVPIHS